VPNLYYWDLLPEAFQASSPAAKLNSELHILINFIIATVFNANEFLFTLFLLCPSFIIAIGF
jgi:hypothetical protein